MGVVAVVRFAARLVVRQVGFDRRQDNHLFSPEPAATAGGTVDRRRWLGGTVDRRRWLGGTVDRRRWLGGTLHRRRWLRVKRRNATVETGLKGG